MIGQSSENNLTKTIEFSICVLMIIQRE